MISSALGVLKLYSTFPLSALGANKPCPISILPSLILTLFPCDLKRALSSLFDADASSDPDMSFLRFSLPIPYSLMSSLFLSGNHRSLYTSIAFSILLSYTEDDPILI